MRWLDTLERRFGFLGIPGLIRIVVAFSALVFLLVRLNPDFISALDLNPERLRHGEIWRLVTYIFIPQTFSFLWIIFVLRFILPVKIKWVAWVSAAFLLLGFFLNSNSYRMATVAALSNYLIFFGPEIVYEARHRQEVSTRRRRFESHARSETEPLHQCAVCGATELSDSNLDFRIARDGEEYCVAHLPKAESAARL